MDKCPSLHTPQWDNSEICATQYLRGSQPFLPTAVPPLDTLAFLLSLSHSPPFLRCVSWEHLLNKLYTQILVLGFALGEVVTQCKPVFISVFKLVFHILKDTGKSRQNMIYVCLWYEIVQPWMNFLFHLISLILIPGCCLQQVDVSFLSVGTSGQGTQPHGLAETPQGSHACISTKAQAP